MNVFPCMMSFLNNLSHRSLVCMGEPYLVLPTEHLDELALFLQQPFQQFNRCPYLDLEIVVFLHFLLTMMDFLLKNLQQRLHL